MSEMTKDYSKFIVEYNGFREAIREVWKRRAEARQKLKEIDADFDRLHERVMELEKQLLEIDASGNEVTIDLRGLILRIEPRKTE